MTPVACDRRDEGRKFHIPSANLAMDDCLELAAYAVVADPQGLACTFPLALGKVSAPGVGTGEFPLVFSSVQFSSIQALVRCRADVSATSKGEWRPYS